MSAEDQSSVTQSAPETDVGPVDIVFNLPDTDKGDVIDVEAKEVEAKATPDPEQTREEKTRKGGLQERIDELTKARRESEREAAYWKARAAVPDNGQAPAQKDPNQAPTQADYNTQEEFIDALADYKVEQKLSARESAQKQSQVQEARSSSWETRLNEARAEIPDFNQVMDSADVPVANHVAELLMEHELGAKLAHHLAKNNDVLDKLNAMSPAKVAFEIGELASQFRKAETAPPVDKPVSKAPPPAKVLGQGRSTSPTLEDMSMDDYVKQRRAQGASWAR